MRIRQICFGLVLALGLPGLQAGAATMTASGGPALGGCSNVVCYLGPPTSGSLSTTDGEAFMRYNASVNARGLFADFSVFGFASNSGELTLRSTDLFTVGQIKPGGPTTLDITARLRVTGRLGVGGIDKSRGWTATGSARAIINTPGGVPGGAVLDGSNTNDSVNVDFTKLSAELPPEAGVTLTPWMLLRVEVGRAFELEKRLALNVGFNNASDSATGGAAFGQSALIEFDLPEGFFITSERGYSQGLPVDPTDPIDPSVIPLPAGGLLLLSAFGLMGWASRYRRARHLDA